MHPTKNLDALIRHVARRDPYLAGAAETAVEEHSRIHNVEPVVALAMLVRSGIRRLHASRSYANGPKGEVTRARAERRRAAGITKPRRRRRTKRARLDAR